MPCNQPPAVTATQPADYRGPQQMELSRKGKHLIYPLTYPPHSDT